MSFPPMWQKMFLVVLGMMTVVGVLQYSPRIESDPPRLPPAATMLSRNPEEQQQPVAEVYDHTARRNSSYRGIKLNFVTQQIDFSEIRRDGGFEAATVPEKTVQISDEQETEWRRANSVRHFPSKPSNRNAKDSNKADYIRQTDFNKNIQSLTEKLKPSTLAELEWLQNTPPITTWLKKPDPAKNQQQSKMVRSACLYAGFVRDFERMFSNCASFHTKKFCKNPKRRKMFGEQREKLLDTTHCDVFMSTWNIRGGGRYSTTDYRMTDVVHPTTIKHVYGNRLAGLHVQNYSAYQSLWRFMFPYPRPFPQTRPQGQKVEKGSEWWSGTPELNLFMRRNDYSQAYKHWCVVNLALLSKNTYDVFFRLRTDLRMTKSLGNIRFLDSKHSVVGFELEASLSLDGGAGDGDDGQQSGGGSGAATSSDDDRKSNQQGSGSEDGADDSSSGPHSAEKAPSQQSNNNNNRVIEKHSISAKRIHTSNFDIADFGFMGLPSMITHLSTAVWMFCLQDPLPYERYLNTSQTVSGMVISEYNLVLWRIIFDNKWEVDSGHRYLWISRRWGMTMKGGKGVKPGGRLGGKRKRPHR